ncbi:hypothetical protein V8F33_012899 [Rhypophila sp. PSN 637]
MTKRHPLKPFSTRHEKSSRLFSSNALPYRVENIQDNTANMETHSSHNSGPPPFDGGADGYRSRRHRGGDSYHPDNRDRDRRQDRDLDRTRYRERDHAADRDRNSGLYDSYRGNGYSRDSDRDGGRVLAPPPHFLPPRPSNPSAGPPRLADYNSYRPPVSFNVPKASFDFRVNAPAAVQQALDRQDQEGSNSHKRRRGPSDQRHDARRRAQREEKFGGKSFRARPPYRPFVAAERELLSGAHTDMPAEALYDEGAGSTYRNLSDVSDDEEADMDISDDSSSHSESDAQEARHKRARSNVVGSATGDDVPKWSNPDPYTALPPEAAAQRAKNKDVVQLIRKARVQPKEVKTSDPSQAEDQVAEDFISLDVDSDESDAESASGIQDLNRTAGNLSNATVAQWGQPLTNQANKTEPDMMAGDKPRVKKYGPAVVPGPFPSQPLLEQSHDLGSRKRTHDDRIKGPFQPKKAPGGPRPKGDITSDWLSVSGINATPWLRSNAWKPDTMKALHQEIVDFYNYVRPRAFEDEIRDGLVRDLSVWVRRKFRDAEVYPFGSYASGLYLPTGDMDLAFLSDEYKRGGYAKYHTKSTLFKLRGLLNYDRKAWQNDIECIIGAKVPIVKYVDSKTALKVDISFENTSGIVAIETFKQWKHEYPAMPVLVTLIKQFLAMRGLNEPVNGGIGGFSVICLVVCLFQHEPSFQTKSLDTTHALGEVLMRFFEFYGKIFNYKDVAISVKPPKLVKKVSHKLACSRPLQSLANMLKQNEYGGFPYKNYDRLSIIDPNNPANDIAGGSANFATIRQVFSQAHDDLAQRMYMLHDRPDAKDQSILGVILGGNYSSFESQRNHLRELSERLKRS